MNIRVEKWDSIEERLRELEEAGIISRETEPRATLEEVRRELEEAWSVNPPKPGGLARFPGIAMKTTYSGSAPS